MDVLIAAQARRVTEFWAMVQRGSPDQCWPWLGYINPDGYGEFYFDGRMYGAHELAVTFTTGETRAAGLDTCHGRECVSRACCNPVHVRFDTRLSNVADGLATGAMPQLGRKFREEQVRLIRLRIAAGARQRDIALEYDTSEAMISMIKNKRRYADVG